MRGWMLFRSFLNGWRWPSLAKSSPPRSDRPGAWNGLVVVVSKPMFCWFSSSTTGDS